MTKSRKLRWIVAGGLTAVAIVAALLIAASVIARRFEPMIREQAIKYLKERFHADVELAAIHIQIPRLSVIDVVRNRGTGTKALVEAERLSMRFSADPAIPPLFAIRKLRFQVDLGILASPVKTVDHVTLDGVDINIPPKGDKPRVGSSGGSSQKVVIEDIDMNNAHLALLPTDRTKTPLRFEISKLHLKSVGQDTAMHYDATMTIPKPPGDLHSQGSFGPWSADEPGDTPLSGDYVFEKADLGIFKGIAGILTSTGKFEGTLDAVTARGEARVSNFRLKSAGNPVPLTTRFEVLVDGTNGNTVLKPVIARLGQTNFTTTGAVIKHEDKDQRRIDLQVNMPDGNLADMLRLAVKGEPFMQGRIRLKTRIVIPPLTGPVNDKLLLDGSFELREAKFLRSTIQDQIDNLSRRGQGQPKNEEIDQVVSNMAGKFHLENQLMTFRSLSFEVPGAQVALAGDYELEQDVIDFKGDVRLRAKVSETMTGWKRWALKPVDPFFAKNGAGTYLKIKVEGDSHHPKFGLNFRSHDEGEATRSK